LVDIYVGAGDSPLPPTAKGVDVTREELAERRHVDLLRTSSALCPER
jgi:hypothetical protein